MANPAELTPRIEPAGAAVGSPVPVQQNPFAFPPHTANMPVGAPVPQVTLDPHQYRTIKKTYRHRKSQGTATPEERTYYRTLKKHHRSIKRGRGIVASGLVNDTAKGGKLASLKKLQIGI